MPTDNKNAAPSPLSDSDGSTPEVVELAKKLTSWKDRLLRDIANDIERHEINEPIEDFSKEDHAFERGLSVALKEVINRMDDKGRFNS